MVGNRILVRALMALVAVVALSLPVKAAEEECLSCHGDKTDSHTPYIDAAVLNKSVHAGLDCKDCHDINSQIRHVDVQDVLCGKCHLEAATGYAKSPHVKGREVSLEDIPTCVTCHGSHDILAVDNPNSPTNHRNSVKICTRCHEDQNIKEKFAILPEPRMIVAYEMSVHGKALMVDGNDKAPACVDCHGSHSFMPADDPNSPIYKTHIASTCGNCHDEIARTYESSVHGTALANGVLESPTCTNCHGEHDIRAHLDPESRVYATNVPKTCSECHASEKIVGKFGLKADRIATFNESFHGIANEFGEARAANCASCHGVHNIYPQSDPRSMINQANIQATCGQCHDNLPADFARGTVHTSARDKESGGKFYVRKFYLWFIPIIVVAFLIYRVLEYKRRIKRVE